jgi:immune inhibitor A
MEKNKFFEEYFFERHPHPSVYKKLRKTKQLIKEGVNPSDFEKNGGVDKETKAIIDRKVQSNDEWLKEMKREVQMEETSTHCKKLDVKGNKRALVLLINFKDTDRNKLSKPQHFSEILFGKSKHSMRNYFLEASCNKLTISGDVSPEWYQAKHDASYYIDKERNHYPKAKELVKEALTQAKKSGHFNFSEYAVDGKVEMLIVVFSGVGFDTSLKPVNINPHSSSLGEIFELQSEIGVDRYIINSELPKEDLGSFCHEVGHNLGLHDHYKDGYSPIVGGWCSMAVGCFNDNSQTPALPCAYCRSSLGWVEPEIVKGKPKKYRIPGVLDDKKIYKLFIEDSNELEYFLVENRQKVGFDSKLPANGLLIWHVDERSCIYKNNDPNHLFLTLEQADGLKELEMDYYHLDDETKDKVENAVMCGNKGDVFGYSNKTFDDRSNPCSISREGKETGITITSISDPDDVMTAVMGYKLNI